MRISDWSSDVCSSDLPALNVGGIEHRLSRTRGGGDELFVTPDIARRGQSTRPTGDRDNPFLDRHLDAVILDPDDAFGPDPAHLHPVGADDKRALTVCATPNDASPRLRTRSAARSVGKEWGRTGSPRWARENEK